MTPAGIEPETFRFVAQHLNHCVTAVPKCYYYLNKLDADCMKALHLDYNFTSLKNELSRNSDFLGAFPLSRKALISFMTFCPSVRKYQRDSH